MHPGSRPRAGVDRHRTAARQHWRARRAEPPLRQLTSSQAHAPLAAPGQVRVPMRSTAVVPCRSRQKRGTAVSRTARLPRRVLVPTTMALMAAAPLALSGCAAGQYSQTADQVAAIDGANGTVGDIAVLNARLAPTRREDYPAGSDANCCSGSPTTACSRTPSPESAPRPPSRSRSPATRPCRGRRWPISPPTSGTQVMVTGFLQDQYYGVSIPMTFSFANAGTLSLNIPIEVPAERSTDRRDDRTSCRRTRPDLGRGSARRSKRPAATRSMARQRHAKVD